MRKLVKIDFSQFIDENSQVLSGREVGEKANKDIGFDGLIKDGQDVEVFLPEALRTIHPSFGLGFFGNIIRELGAKNFKKRVTFSFGSTNATAIESLRDDLSYVEDRSLRKF